MIQESSPVQNTQRLITKEFIALNAIVFLTYCNIALFFQFHLYLGTLRIDPKWFGLLISLFSLSVLVIRPLISPFLYPGNAVRWIGISAFFVTLALIMYNVATDFWSLALIRVLHGGAYVLLVTAVLARLVASIPEGRSGQAFGAIAVITLLPYAVIPPLIDPLIKWLGSYLRVLELSAAVMVLIFPCIYLIGGPQADTRKTVEDRVRWSDVAVNLKDARMLVLLFLALTIWTSFTPIFYYLKSYGEKMGAANPGWFFTFSTFTEMGVRVIAGSMFDKIDKTKTLAVALGWLALGYVALVHVPGPGALYAMGLFMGLGWGVAMPVVSALIFDLSPPRLRAMNTNLAMEMFQGGFFLGPLLGGAILIQWGYQALFYACGGILLVSLAMIVLLVRNTETSV
jgi:MFS family permease